MSRQVSGTAEVESVFCAIPLQQDIYKRAMLALHRHARLDENEMLVNLREDYDFSVYFGLYCKKRLTISADVAVVKIGGGPGTESPVTKKKSKATEPKLPPPMPEPEE